MLPSGGGVDGDVQRAIRLVVPATRCDTMRHETARGEMRHETARGEMRHETARGEMRAEEMSHDLRDARR
jgi:hypothetical protein